MLTVACHRCGTEYQTTTEHDVYCSEVCMDVAEAALMEAAREWLIEQETALQPSRNWHEAIGWLSDDAVWMAINIRYPGGWAAFAAEHSAR